MTWGYKRIYDWHYGWQDHNTLGACAKDFSPHNQLMVKVLVRKLGQIQGIDYTI